VSDPPKVSRRLVAVFAADVEGYSRLMGADEVGTLQALTERRAILDGLIADHGGRIANTAGDSVLAEFGSAVDAVQCAVEAQTALGESNAAIPPDQRVSFRIGVHIGDVMVRAGDLFGDGVNIAARLQTLAKPGTVCVSGATYDQVRKVLPMTFEDLGVQQVKNIQEPIRAYQAGATREAVAPARVDAAESPPSLPDKPSIAVLPFQNMSGDPEQEYFADGMVEEIITALSRFKSLFVIARNSSFRYKGKPIDIKTVGRELGVRYVLEGSVRKAGPRVRITGQLIEAATGTHLWADKFEGLLDEVFDLQDRVTSNVVGIIAPKIERAEIERVSAKPTESLEAYDWYLRGIAIALELSGKDQTENSIRMLKKALEPDPNFAAAMSWIGGVYVIRALQGWMVDPVGEVHEALNYARVSQELGRNDAHVLARSALTITVLGNDLKTASSLVDRALSLNPNEVIGLQASGWLKLLSGEPQQAIERFAQSLQLNPFDTLTGNVMSGLAWAHLLTGELTEAQKWAQKATADGPNYLPALRASAAIDAALGQFEQARQTAGRILELNPGEKISTTAMVRLARQPEDRARLVELLRLAGLPE
jgi:TolB-like protein/class 3 adenylate cyclase